MVAYFYEVFANLRMVVDGADYRCCCFRNCTLVYEGGEAPEFQDCSFIDCTWLLGRVSVTQVKFMSIPHVSEASELFDHLMYASRRATEAQPSELKRNPAAA